MSGNESIPILRIGEDLKDAPQNADPTSAKLFNDLKDSVVRIEGKKTVGSGFAVGKPGEIMTNFHVVVNEPEIFVRTTDGQRFRARIKSVDDVKDLATLEIEGWTPNSLKPIALGDDKTLKLNQQISALGHPEGKESVYISPGTLAERTTNFKRFTLEQMRDFAKLKAEPWDKQAFLQNDLLHGDIQIRRGNSGGPAVDNAGSLVGVTVYKSETTGRDAFFIPSSEVKSFLERKDQKFKFNYEYQLSDSLTKDYLKALSESPLPMGGLSLGAGYLGVKGISDLGMTGKTLSTGIAAYGALGLLEDYSALQKANNNRDMFKAGLNTFGDSALLAGGLTRSMLGVGTRELLSAGESQLASSIGTKLLGASGTAAAEGYLSRSGKIGLAIIAVGVAAKIASDLIPNRLVNTTVQRTDGKTTPPFWLGRQ